MTELYFQSATELTAMLRNRQISAVEVVEAHLAQIARRNGPLNAVITLDTAGALAQAAAADRALAAGLPAGPLHGLPMTLKDCHSTAGMRTTAGYPPLAAYVPLADSSVTARLRAAGAIILGKTNVPPLASHIQTDNPIFGRTNNPWDLQRTPGGSSGGAVAALAAGMTPIEIGSDTAASIRLPAHFAGVFGLKPTYNRVSLAGHIPDLPAGPRIDRELTVIGPLARSIADLRLAFGVIAGYDPRDPQTSPAPVHDLPPPKLADLRIAWVPAFPFAPVATDIRHAVERLATTLANFGGRVEQALPADSLFEQQRTLWADFTRIRRYLKAAFHGDVAPDALSSSPPTLPDLYRALQGRDELLLAWECFFDDWDVLLCPVGATTAFTHCERDAPVLCDGELIAYREVNHHCVTFSLTGHPAAVLPIGFDSAGLPIGVQIVTRRWDDDRLLAIAATLAEVAGPFRRPPGY